MAAEESKDYTPTQSSDTPHAMGDSLFQVTPILGRKLGQYKILEKIGQGGMGSVFKAFDAALDRFVALKVFFGTAIDDPKQSQRFLREARSLARLSHANLLHIYNVGIENDCQYFAMELLSGATLSATIRRRQKIEARELIEWTGQLLNALEYVHRQGIIHRDIKSGNIMICDRRCVLMDFGLIKDDQMAGLTSVGAIMGTPDYMPPEAVEGISEGPPTDLYSLGVVMFEALTGQLPFTGLSAMSIVRKHQDMPPPCIETFCPEIDPRLAAIVMRCLAKKSKDRYADCTVLAAELAKVHATPELLALSNSSELGSAVTRVKQGTDIVSVNVNERDNDSDRDREQSNDTLLREDDLLNPTRISSMDASEIQTVRGLSSSVALQKKKRRTLLVWTGIGFVSVFIMVGLIFKWRGSTDSSNAGWKGQPVLRYSPGVGGEKLRWIRFEGDDPDSSRWIHEIERLLPSGEWKRERITHTDFIGIQGGTFEFLSSENSNK